MCLLHFSIIGVTVEDIHFHCVTIRKSIQKYIKNWHQTSLSIDNLILLVYVCLYICMFMYLCGFMYVCVWLCEYLCLCMCVLGARLYAKLEINLQFCSSGVVYFSFLETGSLSGLELSNEASRIYLSLSICLLSFWWEDPRLNVTFMFQIYCIHVN